MDPLEPSGSVDDPVTAMRSANRRIDFGGRRPGEYTHWIKEQMSWKDSCYIGTWSFLANMLLEGPEAEALLDHLSINSFGNYPVDKGKHLVQCDEDGNVIAEGVLVRKGEDTFEVHGVPAYWTDFNRRQGDWDATAEFRDTFNFQIQGPNSMKVLDQVTDGDVLRGASFMGAVDITIAGTDLSAVRFGMSGEVGFELQGPGDGQNVWDAIREVGVEHGLQRLSVKTSAINQLEAGIPSRIRDYVAAVFGDRRADYREYLAEYAARDLVTHPVEGSFTDDDISGWYRNPIELGWGRYIDWDSDTDFVGRDALSEIVDDPDRTLVTLEWDDDDVIDVYASLYDAGETFKQMDMPHQQKRAMVADSVVDDDGEEVGVATMRGYSYYFRKMLSLATIDVSHSEPGMEVTVLWGEGDDLQSPTVEPHIQKAVTATVAPVPYKEDKRYEDLSELRSS